MGRYEGQPITRSPIQMKPAAMRISVGWVILGWLLRRLAGLLGGMIRHPWVLLLTAIVVGLQVAQVKFGTTATTIPIVALAVALIVWRVKHPSSFGRFLGWPVKAIVRRSWVYRRGWQPAMTTCGLLERFNDREFLPVLRRVRCVGHVDKVTVRMLPGQILDDYADQGERLAMTFGARDCRVISGKQHGEVDLWFLTHDPLEAMVPPFDPVDPPELTGLPIARREDGEVYRLPLLGTHVLVAGSTGAGKGSVLWSIIRAVSPGIRAGQVQVWGIDPKGGMEFAMGQTLFARYCYGDTDPDTDPSDKEASAAYEVAFADVLEDAVTIMTGRQSRLRGVTRLHQPSPAEPLILILVDELAALTAYVNDRDAKRRIRAALSLLLSQGRAVGVSVVAALQDPKKDVLPFRDLFPTRLALRLTEREQVDMVLGDGYRARGARCDRIPTGLPGVAFVVEDGIPEPARIRFSYLSDADIQAMSHTGPTLRSIEGGEAA